MEVELLKQVPVEFTDHNQSTTWNLRKYKYSLAKNVEIKLEPPEEGDRSHEKRRCVKQLVQLLECNDNRDK